jgi:dethiobiotin synthase
VSLAVVGTSTEVGKTVISALLLARYGGERRLAYWKPVATGAVEGRDTETVQRLAGDRGEVLPESYLFQAPLSPHLAARREGRTIDRAFLRTEHERLCGVDPERTLVVEGAGGLLVPLTEDGYLLADLLAVLRLPSLLVALSTLGTINHTLLTLEAMRSRGIAVAGVVLNGSRNFENRRAIERFGRVEVVAEVEPLTPLDCANLARAAIHFDAGGALRPHLS